MKQNPIFIRLLLILCLTDIFYLAQGQEPQLIEFGSGGQQKMIYDRRQRPQALFANNKVFMVYHGGASAANEEPQISWPFIIQYELNTRTLSTPIKLDEKGGSDQHFCPIIWMDNQRFFHVLYGNHRTPGTHLNASLKGSIGDSRDDWSSAPEVGPSLSYPSIFRIFNNNWLIYYRTHEHRSSWTYRISEDDGRTWKNPEYDVVDLNKGGEKLDLPFAQMDEASSYHTVLPDKSGNFLHVAFCYYDDNKGNLPEKFYNPRYKTSKNLDLKYNLYYLKVDLRTHKIQNFEGESITPPIDLETANTKCKIWDTEWRGAGVPPDIIIDEKDNPAFLHVLSAATPDKFDYYYLRYVNGKWIPSVITASNHEWNSSYLRMADNGELFATVITGEKTTLGKGKMDAYGGGDIEEWKSVDGGTIWFKNRDIVKAKGRFTGWKFNNVQPVKTAEGETIDGLLLFYGWQNDEQPDGRGFLWIDTNLRHQKN